MCLFVALKVQAIIPIVYDISYWRYDCITLYQIIITVKYPKK